MSYVALYRQYRPKKFSEVAGQQVIVQTLQNALKRSLIGHAYLFSGPRGTGKTSVAKIFAKAINCLEMPTDDACGKCDICQGIEDAYINDIIEIDAASNNGVDEIRDLREKARLAPSVCKYKVYIIDEVHMLTTQAFNALLKTLEEPPKHVIFILATTEPHKIPATILSRCQRFDFKNIELKHIVEKLNEIVKIEKIKIEPEAVVAIAENAQGALRDALSLLDQTISFADDEISVGDVHKVGGSVSHVVLGELIKAINDKDTNYAMNILEELLEEGKEINRIISDLIMAFRDILLAKNTEVPVMRYEDIYQVISSNKIYFYLDLLNNLQQDIKGTNHKRAYVELALIKMMNHDILNQIDYEAQITELKRQILEIEEKIVSGNIKVSTPSKKQVPLVTSLDIEKVLNNGNNQKRNFIASQWLTNLTDIPSGLEMTAKMLVKVEVVAGSNQELVLASDDFEIAKALYNEDIKKQVLRLIKRLDSTIKNYYVILTPEWEQLKEIYLDQWKNGNKKPILPKIDLKLYVDEALTKEDKTISVAKLYFGDKVIIKE